MTRRVVDEPLDPASLARGTPDAESGAVVVLCEPGRPGPGPGGEAGGGGDDEAGAGPERGPDGEAAGRALEALEEEVLTRFEVRRCRLRLRPGARPGEAAMAAVVRAPHRRDAFEAARWALAAVRERLRVP